MRDLNSEEEHIRKTIEQLTELDSVSQLMTIFSLNIDTLVSAWCSWDMPNEFPNADYGDIAIRMVMHLHNIAPGLWHEKRQRQLMEYLCKYKPKRICEIGFGTPQMYVYSRNEEYGDKVTLGEYDKTSQEFGKVLLQILDTKRTVEFITFDLNTDTLPCGFDCYLFQDSIEHANDPTNRLKSFVDSAEKGCYFLFLLPLEIENPIPQHSICWQTQEEIVAWLRACGLHILEIQEIELNKDMDIFINSMHSDFKEIFFVCQK